MVDAKSYLPGETWFARNLRKRLVAAGERVGCQVHLPVLCGGAPMRTYRRSSAMVGRSCYPLSWQARLRSCC